jgi:tetratricopeptide (TPR) repeat protein
MRSWPLAAPILVLAAMLCAVAALAESIMYEVRMVPIDRLAKNLEALVARDPNNVQLRVNLARAHAMAYALKKSELPVATSLENQGAYFGWGNNEAIPFKNTPEVSAAQAKAAQTQLAMAIAKYREALAVGPYDLVANLGYAWCLAQSGDRTAAIAAYRKTIDLAWQIEQKPRSAMHGDASITEEAATYLVPLLDRTRDAAEIAFLQERIRIIDKVTTRYITPIAIPLAPGLTVGDLRDEDASVLFDADGSGVPKRWTWITPRAGWLVSDIRREGRIQSALQLFGNVTWWLFWNNGYEPLRALDDDGDGRMTGRELTGIAIWRDANTNGVSDAGEVRPLSEWKIISLSYAFRYDSTDRDEIAYSPSGVTFTDGSVRPTYDLILHRK